MLALDSTYREAAELLEATEASHHGLDGHSSNGIYLEVGGEAEEENEEEDGVGAKASGVGRNNSGHDNMRLDEYGLHDKGVSLHGTTSPLGAHGGHPHHDHDHEPHHSNYNNTAHGHSGEQIIRSRSVNEEWNRYYAEHTQDHPNNPSSSSHLDLDHQFENSIEMPERFTHSHSQLNAPLDAYQLEQQPLLGAQIYRISSSESPPDKHLHAQYQLHHRKMGGTHTIRKYYAPTVIPVVQSKESMVIVGAVLRKDLKDSLSKLMKLAQVASSAPVSEYCVYLYLFFYCVN